MNVHVPFTENIRPICLPYTGINTQYYNQTGTIAGWGKTTDQNHNIVTYGTNKLREVDTLIFNTDLCGKLIHFMGNYAWRQSPSGNSISRYVKIVIPTSKAYLHIYMRKKYFLEMICAHTQEVLQQHKYMQIMILDNVMQNVGRISSNFMIFTPKPELEKRPVMVIMGPPSW